MLIYTHAWHCIIRSCHTNPLLSGYAICFSEPAFTSAFVASQQALSRFLCIVKCTDVLPSWIKKQLARIPHEIPHFYVLVMQGLKFVQKFIFSVSFQNMSPPCHITHLHCTSIARPNMNGHMDGQMPRRLDDHYALEPKPQWCAICQEAVSEERKHGKPEPKFLNTQSCFGSQPKCAF